jgi:type 1 glutamine amidotransferase
LTRNPLCRLLVFAVFAVLAALLAPAAPAQIKDRRPHVVFVTGDEEYRSEESMPLIARLLEKHHGFRCTVLYAVGPDGTINPQHLTSIPGLEALKEADLMVMYTRYRALPDEQLKHILDYIDSGRPMVGFRTTTHAFRYPAKSPNAKWNDEFGRKVFGQQWITHHGHHGHMHLTEVTPAAGKEGHPILRGVKPFKCYSWLYHVHGGKQKIDGAFEPLAAGKSLKSSHASKQDLYPLTQPVAWTRSYTGPSGKKARVFFTTLGHPHDFESESMRKLVINGIYWALGMEDRIPREGANVELLGPFNLTNAGVGAHKKGVRPSEE